jgi:uncharacterized protein YecT (DUF1311 family)
MRPVAVAAILVLLALPAAAEDEIKCNPEGATFEMAACARDDFEKADKKLNTVYQKLLKSLAQADKEYGSLGEESRVKRLKDAQRAWVAWRDPECLLRSVENFGGSIENINIPACMASLTEERAKQLQSVNSE